MTRPAIAMPTQRAETQRRLGLGSWAARAAGIARIIYLNFSISYGCWKQYLAAKKLERIVSQTRNSYECRRYRERRAAALKGLGRA